MSLNGKISLSDLKKRKAEKAEAERLAKIEPVGRPIEEQITDVLSLLNQYDVWVSNKPLKIGIYHDIIKLIKDSGFDCSGNSVRRALNRHTRDSKYLERHSVGIARYALNGDVSGSISEDDAEYAKSKLNLTVGSL